MANSENYKGFLLFSTPNWNTEINGFSFTVRVYNENTRNEDEFLFIEKSQISNFAIRQKYGEIPENVSQEIIDSVLAKVKTRIDLDMYEKGKIYIQQITTENLDEISLPLEDNAIQDYLLKGLLNLRKKYPQTYIALTFNPVGFCEILKIPIETYYFNADLLLEDNLIGTKVENGIEEGMIYITSKGANSLSAKTRQEEIKKVSSSLTYSNTQEVGEKFDIAISFAGEDRDLAEKIAKQLKEKQVKVFYDDFEKSNLWGKNLYDYLSEIYSEKSKYCVMLLSEHYEKKLWTNLERKSAQARAFRENREYILPIRIDSTKISGIHETVGYIDAKTHSIENIVDLILSKLQKI